MPHPPRARELLAHRLRHPPAPPGDPVVLLSIKPHYADLITAGEKRVEFRRRFPRSFTAGRAIFYVSSPTQAITMTGRVAAVRRAAPAALWHEFAAAGGAARAAFDAYFEDADTGVALLLESVERLAKPIPLADPRLTAIDFRPPQSLAVLAADAALVKLIARAGTRDGADRTLFA